MRIDTIEMSPTAINVDATDAVTSLKNQVLLNGGAAQHIIDPEVLTRPNLALWVSKDHRSV
jgi:L-iditol 2-dehydrogenase